MEKLTEQDWRMTESKHIYWNLLLLVNNKKKTELKSNLKFSEEELKQTILNVDQD